MRIQLPIREKNIIMDAMFERSVFGTDQAQKPALESVQLATRSVLF